MLLKLDAMFDRVAAHLPGIRWAADAGQPLPASLATWCGPAASAAEATAAMKSETWETWTADRSAALSTYLHRVHRQRYQDWNAIAQAGKQVLAPHESAITSGLKSAGLTDRVALETVRWDVVGALICAGFMDCAPPTDLLKLLDIYEAGHVPVGWDVERKRVLVY